jgi:hypothetical protein
MRPRHRERWRDNEAETEKDGGIMRPRQREVEG